MQQDGNAVLGRCLPLTILMTLLALFVAFAGPVSANAATVATDKLDYPPGDTVWITGSGFKPEIPQATGELVEMSIRHITKSGASEGEYGPWTAQASPKGDFTSYWVVPFNDSIVGATLELTAIGLTSGLVATTEFTDANVLLTLSTVIPDTICPGDTTTPGGDSLYLCAQLLQGGCELPLANRPVRFFWNPGNCGVEDDAEGEDTVWTDENGLACTDMPIPDVSGSWVLRVKFDGEDKPNPCPTPGNSACDPNNSNAAQRCVNLSASNICQQVTIDSIACCTPPVCSLGTPTVLGPCLPSLDVVPIISVDPDDGIDSCALFGPGELVNGSWQYAPDGGETVNVRVVCYNTCGDSCVVAFERTYPTDVQIVCQVPNDTTIVQCDPTEVSLPAGAPGANCTLIDNSPGALINGNWVYTPTGDDSVSVTIECVDSTGCDTCTATFTVKFDVNEPPTIQCPADVTFDCDNIGDFGTPTVDDDRDSAPSVYSVLLDSTAGNCAQNYTLTIRYVVKDACGDSAYCDQTVTVQDTTAPVFASCEPLYFDCDNVPEEFDPPTATDNCDTSLSYYLLGLSDTTIGDCPQRYSFIVNWTATDDCGNADTCHQVVYVMDTTKPVVTCPPDTTIDCQDVGDGKIDDLIQGLIFWPFGDATATDNCDTMPSISAFQSGQRGELPCSYVIEIGYFATDDCGNVSDTCYRTVTIQDTTKPVLGECVPLVTIACDSFYNKDGQSGLLPVLPTATDNCDNDPEIRWQYIGSGGTWPCNYYDSIAIWAVDTCGNSSDTCYQRVELIDTTAPVIECPISSTVPCSQIPTFWTPPQATDNCSVPQVAQSGEVRWGYADCPEPDTIAITWVATDGCGLADTCEQIVLVVDDTPPVLTCTDLRYHCDSIPAEWPTPTAIDDCDPAPVVTFLDTLTTEPGDPLCPQNYRLTLRWVATDECGNADTCEQFVSVFDVVRPEIVCPDNQEFECDVDTTLFAWPTATDNCDAEPTIELIVYERSPIGQTCGYVLRRGWHAVDDCGNYSDTCYQSITVGDTTRPTVTCPNDTVIACQDIPPTALQNLTSASSKVPIGNYPFGDPSAEDNCDQSPDIFWFIESQSGTFPCDKQFVIGYWALDECGNVSDTCFQDVSIVDTIAPVVVCAPDTTVYCDDDIACLKAKAGRGRLSDEKGLCGFRIVDTVYDNCQGVLDPWYDVFIQEDKCPQYVQVKVWAVDQCGRISDTCTWTAYILDTLAPVVTCPDDIFLECGDAPTDWGTATATDNCSEPKVELVDVDTVATQGECYIEIKRTFVATDFCGLADTCEQTIVIGDSTAPVIVCPPDTTIDCDDLVGIDDPRTTFKAWATESPKAGRECFPVEWLEGLLRLPTATDNCSEEPAICLYDIKLVSEDSCELVVDLSYYAIDDCGNADTCTQRVRIVDETRPVIVCAPDTSILCDRNKAECIDLKGTEPFKLDDNKFLCGFRMIDTVYDACCDEVEVFSFLTYRLNQCPAQIKAFIWAVDCCGNVSDTCTWVLTFDDPTPPEIVCPDDLFYNCDDVQGDWGWPTATDNCDDVVNVTLFDQDTLTEGCETIITRTFLAKDRCENESRCQQVITISDTTAPVCVVPNDTTIFLCEPGEPVCLPVSATDNCDQSVECVVHDGIGEIVNGQWCYTPTGPGSHLVYVRCLDDCGNDCLSSFTVTFAINRAPICYLGEDSTVYLCDPGNITISAAASDPDSNMVGFTLGPVAGPGGKSGTGLDSVEASITFPVERDTVICYAVRAVDACGEECVDTICITVDITEPPVCYETPDTTVVLCNPEEVCIQADFIETVRTTSSDVVRPTRNSKGQIVYPRQPQQPVSPVTKSLTEGCELISSLGELKNGYWCWTPPDYDTTVTVSIRCADTCGHFCSNEFSVFFDMNVNPVCSIFVELIDPICTPDTDFVPLGSIDPDGETECRLAEGPGTLEDGGWRYPDPVPGTSVTVVIVCSDTCGDSCLIEFTRNYPARLPVICTGPEDIDTTLCDPVTLSFPVSGGENSVCSVVEGPGSVVDGNWTYFADRDTSFCVTIRCLSLCDSCDASFCVDVDMNDPPTCDLPNDTTIFLCSPQTVCLPVGATDPNGNFSHCAIDEPAKGLLPGYISQGNWCFDVTEDIEVTVPIVCYDSCGAACRGQFTVRFDVNEPPVCDLPNDTTIFLCEPGTVCLPVSATDADGNLVECQIEDQDKGVDVGYLQNGSWCFDVTGDVTVTVPIVCYDECQASCRGEFTVTFEVNEAPTCSDLPSDTSLFLCEPQQVCVPFNGKDFDDNLTGCEVVSGDATLSGGFLCFTPAATGDYSFTIRCTDECGESCEETITFHITINSSPTCNAPNDTTIALCEPSQVCLSYSGQDVDGNLSLCSVTGPNGTSSGGEWCMFIGATQKVVLTFRCEDACGAFCEKEVTVNFVINQPPVCEFTPLSPPACTPPVAFVPFQSTDPEGGPTTCELIEGKGEIVAGGWQYVDPIPGESFSVVIICEDTCGAKCKIEFTASFPARVAPVCVVPNDTTIFLCSPTQVSLPVSAAGAVCQVVEGPGSISGGMWRYTPTQEGTVSVTVRCSNDCDFCEETFEVTFDFNEPPVCSAPSDTTIILCPDETASMTLNGFDPNNNIVAYQKVSGPGTISGNVWTHTPTSENEFTLRWRVVDACGLADTCQTRVQIYFNRAPMFNLKDDTTITLCGGVSEVCLPLNITDFDNNIETVEVISGVGEVVAQGNGWIWCFTPPDSGTYSTTIKVTDACGRTAQRSCTIRFIIIDEPMCDMLPSGNYTFCQSPVCLPIVGDEPVPQRGVSCLVWDGPGFISGGNWCVNITGTQTFTVVIKCSNTCGQECTILRNYTFTVDPNDCTGPAGVGPDGQTITMGVQAGDVDRSGEINIADLALLTQIVHQTKAKATGAQLNVTAASAANRGYNADVNCDGVIDSRDVADLTAFLFSAGPRPCAE